MTVQYDGELFKISVFLVFCNRFVAVVFALVMICIKGEAFSNKAPIWKYLAISLSNVAASTCQYEALKFVSFPVQMLGKSFKMMPVMLWGMAISGKQYKVTDWIVATAVTWGVTQFLLTGSIGAPHQDGSSGWGLLLLVAFLAFDGFTSTFQEKLFREHTTSKYNQMLYINLGSAVVSLVSLIATNTLLIAMNFSIAHPSFFVDAAELSGAAVAGQFFIYSQVKEFGALVFAATMNVRQVVSILISYTSYGHPISGLQIMALCVIFQALFYKSYIGFVQAGEKAESKPLLYSKKADEEAPGETTNQVPKFRGA